MLSMLCGVEVVVGLLAIIMGCGPPLVYILNPGSDGRQTWYFVLGSLVGAERIGNEMNCLLECKEVVKQVD